MAALPKSALYDRLPDETKEHPAVAATTTADATQQPVAKVVQELLSASTIVNVNRSEQIYDEKVKDKLILLDNPPLESAHKRRQRHRERHNKKPPALNAKEKRKLGVFDLPAECCRFALYEPLHELWKQHMAELHGNIRGGRGFLPKLLKADLHGSLMTVVRSRCPSYIGATGIMIMETKNIFKVVTRQDRVLSIPKAHSVFSISVLSNDFVIYGDQFCYRAAERACRKFKQLRSVDL